MPQIDPLEMPSPDERIDVMSSEPHSEHDVPMMHALFRVMRAVMFDEAPLPELDALPLAQLRLLWSVFFMADSTMKDFSVRLGVSQSTVTQLADRLVKRGLVVRQDDASDRRVVRLQVSPGGRRLLQEANTRQQQTVSSVWDLMSEEERSATMYALGILGERAESVRTAQGRPIPPHHAPAGSFSNRSGEAAETVGQPVVDLMGRRVRGRTVF